MAIPVFTSSSAFFRAMGVSADGVSAFTDPMNTVVDGDAMLSEGESGYVDLSLQPDNVAQDFSPANFVAQDFSPASSIGRAEALRYDWYGGERLAESPATAFLKRLLDPLNRIVRVASLFGDVTALPGYVGEGLRPLPQFREPAEGLPYELGSPHLPASGLVAAAGAPDDEHGGSTAVRSEEGARELMRRLKAEWDDVTWTLVRKIEAGEDVNEIMIWMNVVDSWQQNIKQVRKLRIDLEKSGRLTPALAFEMRSFVHDVLARDVNVFLNGQNALSWKDSAQEALVSLWKTFSPTTPVLADFVGKALDKFHFEAAKRKVRFKDVKISDPAFAPHVPLEKVRAVLENIIENAVKYNKDGGTVKVGFDRALRELVVEDTGIGMAPEFAAQWGTVQGVREGRAMNSDGTPVEGTGAGSVIVKRAIEELGWELRIESTPDAGSKFIITIPEKDLVSAGKVMLPGKGPAVELPDVVPAMRPNEIRLHVGVSDDLKNVTYSLVDDGGEIKALSTVPSSYLVTPERYLRHHLSDELRGIILPLIKAARRLTTYRGITVSWDLAADKDVWTTNIDTIFLHKRAEDAGILNDPSVRSALEVGVGGAHSSVAMAQYLPNLARLSVTDISHNALRVARLMLDPAIKKGLPVRYYWGKGLRTIDDKFDLIWVNPPYIPVPPSMAKGDGDPYRGTGLIREIFEMGVERLNSDNPNARIVTNISSLAAKDLARYMKEFGDRLVVEKLGEPLKVPLKIGAIDKAWLDWLVSEGGLEFRPDAASDEEPYWHTLQVYSIRPKPAGASATSTVTHPLTGEALDLKALDKKAIFALIMEGRAYFKKKIAEVAKRLKAGEDPKKLGAEVVGDEDAKRVMNDMIDVINRFSKSIGDEMFAMAARHRFARPAYTYLASIGTFLELEMLDRLPVYTDNPYNVSIKNIVFDTIDLLRGEIVALGKNIKIPIADDLPNKDLGSMGIDAEAVEVTVEELIWNAAKYAPDGSTVEISWDEGSKKITVSNEGDPFEAGFDPFAPDNRGTNAGDVQGTGYGLAAAREDAEENGWWLSHQFRYGHHHFRLTMDRSFARDAKFRDRYPIEGAHDAREVREFVEAELTGITEGKEGLMYLSVAANQIGYSLRFGHSRANAEFIDLFKDIAEQVRATVDKARGGYELGAGLRDGQLDVYNVMKHIAGTAEYMEKKLVGSQAATLMDMSNLADIYHVAGKYGYMFYGTNDAFYRAQAIITLLGAKARFEALREDDKAGKVAADIEAIRKKYDLPEELEGWAREYVAANAADFDLAALEDTGNYGFAADVLAIAPSPRPSPSGGEGRGEGVVEALRERWKNATSDGGLAGFRSGMKLWDDFARVTDLPAFRSRVEADLAKLSDEGRLSYIGQISSGVENIFYSSPSDDVPILYARLDFIHLLASEASSARDRLPSQDAENPLWGYSVDLWNLFNSLAHAAVAIEKKLVEKNALDPRVSEQIADILFVMAGKGALYYDYHDGSPSNAFAQLPDVIARYHMLGLEEKAQRAEQLSTEVQARFGITDDPFEWARDYIKHNIKKDLRLIMDVPEEESRRSLLETINIGFESSGSHGNYRFAAEVFRYYAGALFDIAQKMEEAGKPDDVWQTFSDAATHFRQKYIKAREMGIAIGTIEANPELKDKGSVQGGQKSDALKLTELIGADDAEFAAAVEKMRTLLEDEALEVATQLGRMAEELVRRHVERLSAPGVDAEVVRSVRQDFKMAYRQRWHVLAEAIKPSMAAKQHRIWTALYSSACQVLEGLSSHLNILNDEINLDGFDSDSVRKRLERARRIADTAKYPVLENRGYEVTRSLVELSGGLLHHIGLREAEKRWDGDDIVFSAPANSKIDGSIRGIEVTSWSENVPNDPALKIYLKLLGWTMKVAPADDGIFDVRINFGNGALPTAGHPRAVPAGRQENGAPVGSGYSSATAGGDDKAPRRHERYFPDPLLASPGPDGEGLGGLTRSQDTNRFKGREFGINGADDSGRLELGMKLTVADLAKLSDKEQLAYIKDISREAERHFERSPSGDVAVLRERLALIAPLAERASLAHDRLLSRGVKYPLWGHGDLCNLFNPLARVAVDIEARLVDQNALTPATSEQIADILFYGILNGTPYYDRSDGELETTFSRLPDVIERYRALNLREKTQRAEGFLHEVQHKFGREKKAPFAWALGEIGTKVGKYLVLMQRETKGPHKSVWLGTIKNIIILSGSHGNYRFAAEVFRYYAGALFGVRQKMEEEGKPIEAWKSFNEAASDFHAKYLKARKMGVAIGTIEMRHPITGEPLPRERIDRPFIDGLVTEIRRYFKGKFNDILKRYAAGEDRNGLVREIEREALQGRAGDAYDYFLEIAEWFGRVNGDLEGGFLAAMRHRMALPYRVYRGLATYIRRDILDRIIAEGRLDIHSDVTSIYQAVYDIQAILGSKISEKGIDVSFDPGPFQKATVAALTNLAMFERVAEVLISNAVNYGEHNVRVEWDDPTWTLIVTNDGPGIEAGKDIFQAGVRGTNTKGIEGTGYGLFTAKEDAASQGWSLSFTSRPGETVFRLRLSKPKN